MRPIMVEATFLFWNKQAPFYGTAHMMVSLFNRKPVSELSDQGSLSGWEFISSRMSKWIWQIGKYEDLFACECTS